MLDEPGLLRQQQPWEGKKTHYLTVYWSTVTMIGSLPGSQTILIKPQAQRSSTDFRFAVFTQLKWNRDGKVHPMIQQFVKPPLPGFPFCRNMLWNVTSKSESTSAVGHIWVRTTATTVRYSILVWLLQTHIIPLPPLCLTVCLRCLWWHAVWFSPNSNSDQRGTL